AAMRGGFGAAPDVVLSGVNLGANLGRAVLHSGTVGAALTAGEFGARALAVSLDVPVGGADILHWASAAEVVRRVLPLVLEAEAGTVLNLNVPNLPADRIGPVRRARLTRFGMVQSRLERFDDGALKLVTVARDGEPEPDSDAGLLAAGHATITPLCSVTEDVDVQLPELAHTGG